jgi:hypothetical protein
MSLAIARGAMAPVAADAAEAAGAGGAPALQPVVRPAMAAAPTRRQKFRVLGR